MTKNASELFDKNYYFHSCGRPYQRDEHWLSFFDQIAEKIQTDIQPKSVLDAGCAMGFLVEKLRERSIEAYGIDVSEYAIRKVHPSVQGYCHVASVTEPLPRKYDLIVCIEVLEHLPQAEGKRALENLCANANMLLFSSTPFDFKEPTHFNVQPPDYWAGLFIQHGFSRDVDFDASFITPWAMFLTSEDQSRERLVRNFERKLWLLQRENSGLRDLSLEVRNSLSDAENAVGELREKLADFDEIQEENRRLQASRSSLLEKHSTAEAKLAKLQGELDALEADKRELEERLDNITRSMEERVRENRLLISRIDGLEERVQAIDGIEREKALQEEELNQALRDRQLVGGKLAEIETHIGWRLVTRLQRMRIRIIPHGSKRERLWKDAVSFFHVWLDLGLRAAFLKTLAKMRGKPIGHTLQDDYQDWIDTFEPSLDELRRQRIIAKSFDFQPRISFITPVFNPPEIILREMIESVLQQTYTQWDLCIADASAGNTGIRDLLREYCEQDPRIKVQFLDKNHGIAENSNRALKLAQGEFIALLDHDDTLAPNMLFEVVRQVNEDPEADLIYFDEDKLSSDGRFRKNPWFKPDWSPELLISANYLMHSVIRRELVTEVGRFNPAMDGAQDWDLILRCSERAKGIKHIPKILYHWREVEGSAASDFLAKAWVFENQLRAVEEHLDRIGIAEGEASFDSPGFLRVRWPVKGSNVSIIIPTRDRVDLLGKCISSIREKTNYKNYEIVIVDNGSEAKATLEYFNEMERHSNIRVIPFPDEFNYSRANNIGAEASEGDVFLFLNNDIEILESDWLEEMLRWAEREEIGVVGAKLLYPNGAVQHAGVILGMQGHASHVFMGSLEKQTGPFGSVDWYRNYSAVTGACMMIRREVFGEVGGFDESYQLVFSDVELCVRIRDKGYRILYNPFVRLCHYEGQSRGQIIPAEDIWRGYIHLKDLVDSGDIYFNRNLSYDSRIPSLRSISEISRLERLEAIVEHHSKNEYQ
jgi:GT2 family glycosyltransferase/SAM-dependent methyltransferase